MYLGDELVAEVTTPRTGKMTLTYRPEVVERVGLGALVLSAALPAAGASASRPARSAPFLEGLLPDGWARAGLERRFDVHRVDSFSLLAAVGAGVRRRRQRSCPRACAGPGPRRRPELRVRPLDEAAIGARLAGARADDPFGVDDRHAVTPGRHALEAAADTGPDGTWPAPAAGALVDPPAAPRAARPGRTGGNRGLRPGRSAPRRHAGRRR